MKYSDDELRALVNALPPIEVLKGEQLRRSFHKFVRESWEVLEPSRKFVDGWHIGMIGEYLTAMKNRELKFVVFNVPPGSMKSLLVNVNFPAWTWADAPHERFLCLSNSDDLPTRDSLKCRRIIESEWYQKRWGHVYQLRDDQNAKTKYETDKTGSRGIGSFAGTIIGERAGFILIDDPHKTDLAESDTVRENKLIKFKEEVYTRREDENSVVAVIMQRLNDRDLAGYCLSEGYADAHCCIPMRFESDRSIYLPPIRKFVKPDDPAVAEYQAKLAPLVHTTDPRTVDGELMCPERFPETEVQKLEKVLGSFGAAGQLQQRPTPRGGGIVTKEDFRFYRKADGLPEFDMIVDSWDMAFKDTNISSYVAGGKWARFGIRKYLLKQVRERMTFTQSLEAVLRMRDEGDQYPSAVLVEDKANGPAVIDTLKEKVSGLTAVEPRGSKFARASSVSPQIEAGEIWLPHPDEEPWVEAFIAEWCAIPGNAFWDQVDQTSQALDYLARHEPFDTNGAVIGAQQAASGESYLGGLGAV